LKDGHSHLPFGDQSPKKVQKKSYEIQADLSNLPLRPEKFDGGIFSLTLEYSDPNKALEMASKALKPGSPLLITAGHPESGLSINKELQTHASEISYFMQKLLIHLSKSSESKNKKEAVQEAIKRFSKDPRFVKGHEKVLKNATTSGLSLSYFVNRIINLTKNKKERDMLEKSLNEFCRITDLERGLDMLEAQGIDHPIYRLQKAMINMKKLEQVSEDIESLLRGEKPKVRIPIEFIRLLNSVLKIHNWRNKVAKVVGISGAMAEDAKIYSKNIKRFTSENLKKIIPGVLCLCPCIIGHPVPQWGV